MEIGIWRKKHVIWLMVMVFTILMLSADCREPVLHRVGGGKYTWKLGVNFTDWASHEHFYVGDWLYFGFNKSVYNVLEVNKTSYERCIDEDFIKNITRGGRDVFNLTEEKAYYFISGFRYCLKGLKLGIYVQNAPPDPTPNSSLRYTDIFISVIAASAMMIFALFF